MPLNIDAPLGNIDGGDAMFSVVQLTAVGGEFIPISLLERKLEICFNYTNKVQKWWEIRTFIFTTLWCGNGSLPWPQPYTAWLPNVEVVQLPGVTVDKHSHIRATEDRLFPLILWNFSTFLKSPDCGWNRIASFSALLFCQGRASAGARQRWLSCCCSDAAFLYHLHQLNPTDTLIFFPI